MYSYCKDKIDQSGAVTAMGIFTCRSRVGFRLEPRWRYLPEASEGYQRL